MSYGDPFTFDDVERAHAFREPLTLTVDQVRDLVERFETVDETALDEAYCEGEADATASYDQIVDRLENERDQVQEELDELRRLVEAYFGNPRPDTLAALVDEVPGMSVRGA